MSDYQYPTGTGQTGATGATGLGFGNVVAKTANYTIASGDKGAEFTFNGTSLTATLPSSAPAQPWMVVVINLNSSSLTLSPNGLNLNGSSSSLTVSQNEAVFVWSDGSNYFYAAAGGSGGGSSTLAGLTDVSISSPSNNQVLTYNSGASKWENETPGSNIPSGTPLLPCNRFSSSDSNFAGDSIWGYFFGAQLVNMPANWKIRLGCIGGTGVHVASAVVYRTAPQSLVVTDVTVIKFSGSSTFTSSFSGASASAPFFVVSDAISVVLDTAHDYYVVFFLNSDGSGFNAALHLPRTYGPNTGYTNGFLYGNFQTGDKTGTSVGGTLVPPGNGADGVFWDVIVA